MNPFNFDKKFLDLKEFVETGYLQEANRLFFHPLGLALAVSVVDTEGWDKHDPMVARLVPILEKHVPHANPDTLREIACELLNALYPPDTAFLSSIWDERDDSDGLCFSPEELLTPSAWEKYLRVTYEAAVRAPGRRMTLSNMYRISLQDAIQPILRAISEEKTNEVVEETEPEKTESNGGSGQ